MKKIALKANDKDNIATLFAYGEKGDEVIVKDKAGKENIVKINDDIDYGHKFAIEEIKQGSQILKYGESIGIASSDIAFGDNVHIHNLESQRGRGDLIDRSKQ